MGMWDFNSKIHFPLSKLSASIVKIGPP